MIKTVLVAVAFGTLSTAAVAADLPRRTAAASPVSPLAAMNWSGSFVGLHGGLEQYGRSYELDWQTPSDPSIYGNATKSSFLGGGHIGHNFQAGAYVYGLIADFEINNTRNTFVYDGYWGTSQKLGLQGSLRARVGYAVGSFLPYLTGGVAVANVSTTYFDYGTNQPTGSETFRNVRFGWTVGGGVEYALTNNWSARLDYRYSDFGRFTHNVSLWTTSDDIQRVTTNKTTLGVSYRF